MQVDRGSTLNAHCKQTLQLIQNEYPLSQKWIHQTTIYSSSVLTTNNFLEKYLPDLGLNRYDASQFQITYNFQSPSRIWFEYFLFRLIYIEIEWYYVKEAEHQLNDKDAYKKLQHDPTQSHTRLVNDTIIRFKNDKLRKTL